MEDTLKKADVALSFLNIAAGKDEAEGSKPRVFDKPDRSVRRALKAMRLEEGPRPAEQTVFSEATRPIPPAEEINGHGYRSPPESVEEDLPRPSVVKFQSSDDSSREE